MDNGHFEMVKGHLWRAECDRKLQFTEEKFLKYQIRNSFYDWIFNSVSYVVGRLALARLDVDHP